MLGRARRAEDASAAAAAGAARVFLFLLVGGGALQAAEGRPPGEGQGGSRPVFGGSARAGATREFWFDTHGPVLWRRNITSFATTRPYAEVTSSGNTGVVDRNVTTLGIPRNGFSNMQEEEICGSGRYISSWMVEYANVSGASAPKGPIVLAFQGICSDGVVLKRYNTSGAALGLEVVSSQVIEIEPDAGKEGFATWSGRLAPYLIAFMEQGHYGVNLPGQSYVDYCPPGMFVSGYQVGQGPLLDQLRIRCSCIKCGCECLNGQETAAQTVPGPEVRAFLDGVGADQSVQTPAGATTPRIPGTCMPPVRGLRAPWCFVDNNTCSAPSFSMSSVPWEYCYNVGDTFAMDTEKTKFGCACKAVFNTTLRDGTVIHSGGRCIKGDFLATYWCPVVPETCNRGAEQSLTRDPVAGMFDVCLQGSLHDPDDKAPVAKDSDLAMAPDPFPFLVPGFSNAPFPDGAPLWLITSLAPSQDQQVMQAKPPAPSQWNGRLRLGLSIGFVLLAAIVGAGSCWLCLLFWQRRRAGNKAPGGAGGGHGAARAGPSGGGPTGAVLSSDTSRGSLVATPFVDAASREWWSWRRPSRVGGEKSGGGGPMGAVLSTDVTRGPLQSPFADDASREWSQELASSPSGLGTSRSLLGFRWGAVAGGTTASGPYDASPGGPPAPGGGSWGTDRLAPVAAFAVPGRLRPAAAPGGGGGEGVADVEAGLGPHTPPLSVSGFAVGGQAADLSARGRLALAAQESAQGSGSLAAELAAAASPGGALSSRPDWEVDPGDLQLCVLPDGSNWKLGSGAYGQVYKALLGGVQPVAVKFILGTPRDGHESLRSKYAREVALLKELRNPHILQFLGATTLPQHTLLVTELMENGDLYTAIAQNKVNWRYRGKRIMADVARGLAYLHAHRIAHLDIKSANVLLTRDFGAKIGDVGVARVLSHASTVTRTGSVNLGTFAWSAPELLLGALDVNEQADIYSFGIVLWEVITGDVPIRGRLRQVSAPEECSEDIKELLDACIQTDPAARPTARELVERLGGVVAAGSGPLPTPGLSPVPDKALTPNPSAPE